MRYVISVGILLALIGGLVGVKYAQISTLKGAGAAAQKMGPPPEVIGTTPATEDHWESTLSSVGTIAAVRGVTISNEAPGVVTAIHFESGNVVKAGQLLVELDTSVERAQLASAKAKKELAEVGMDRSRKLANRDMVAKAQLDGDEATLKTSAADFSALQAQIEKKSVRAPFAGRLGIRTVNLGQYLNPGTALTVLESLGSVYVDFTLPQQVLSSIKVGMPVKVAVTGLAGGDLAGTVAAVDPAVDSVTRTIKLRAGIPNKGDKLRPGMFATVSVMMGTRAPVVVAPVTAVVHASYGDSVFVVEEKDGRKIARQQFVRVGETRGDFVSLVDGVKPGQELVTAGAFKLRNGSPVTVNNDVKTQPALQPNVPNL